MSVGDFSDVPRNVVLDDGEFYKIIYEDGKILITTCEERINWLRLELINLVRGFFFIFSFPVFLSKNFFIFKFSFFAQI